VSKNIEFERSHSIEYLIELCSRVDTEFSEIEAGNLSDYAVEMRYPDDFFIPSLDEAQNALELAAKIKNFVMRKLNLTTEELFQ